jgi:Domain of unknown function (DUF4112)
LAEWSRQGETLRTSPNAQRRLCLPCRQKSRRKLTKYEFRAKGKNAPAWDALRSKYHDPLAQCGGCAQPAFRFVEHFLRCSDTCGISLPRFGRRFLSADADGKKMTRLWGLARGSSLRRMEDTSVRYWFVAVDPEPTRMSLVRTPPRSRSLSQPQPVRRLDPQLELLAYWMDTVFEIPGLRIRFGFDAIIGLIPGLGDVITSLISLYILAAARRYGVPRATLLRMAFNIAVDTLVGTIPLLGDAFDVYWKANVMNVALLRRHVLATPAEQRSARRKDTLFVAGLIIALLALLAAIAAISYWLIAAISARLF